MNYEKTFFVLLTALMANLAQAQFFTGDVEKISEDKNCRTYEGELGGYTCTTTVIQNQYPKGFPLELRDAVMLKRFFDINITTQSVRDMTKRCLDRFECNHYVYFTTDYSFGGPVRLLAETIAQLSEIERKRLVESGTYSEGELDFLVKLGRWL